MNRYGRYWIASLIRGLLALVIGTGIVFLSDMAKTILLLPLVIVLSSVGLAAYGVVDSSLVLASSFLFPRGGHGRTVMRGQGLVGIVLGILLFLVASEKLQLSWFLYLATAQAVCTAVAEFAIGTETATHHSSRWCYVSAVIALLSAIGLLLSRHLVPHDLAWVIYGYLGFFGLNMLVLSAHMLSEEAQLKYQHPT